MNGIVSLKFEDKKTTAAKIRELTKNFSVPASVVEEMDTSLSFPTLRAEAAKLPTADKEERTQAMHAAALYRSARYAVVGGVYCHTLGIRGRYRGLYDSAKASLAMGE